MHFGYWQQTMLKIKICGITDEAALHAAIDAGAHMAGFMFYAPSPRHLDLAQAAELAGQARGRIKRIAVSVDADDRYIAKIMAAVAPHMLQLHGEETPRRVAQLRERFSVPILKAIKIAVAADLAQLDHYRDVADQILFDARPPTGTDSLPGGNGLCFDWRLLKGLGTTLPFMLSGGLDCTNVGDAIHLLRPAAIDVSSGVERRPGIKDTQKITEFVTSAQNAQAAAAREKPGQ